MLRDRDDASLREYLIATAARLIDERGSAGLSVRDIAREAKVADGALYNYFEDKDDLLAQALLAHVGTVMGQASDLLPPPGTATVAENLAQFVERGIAVLVRVIPAFAGLLSQPGALRRFHDLVGGNAAFEGDPDAGSRAPEAGSPAARRAVPPPRRAVPLRRRAVPLRRRAAGGCRTSSSATCSPSSSSAGSTRAPTSPRPAPSSSARSMARCCRGCCSPHREPPSAHHPAWARSSPRWPWTASHRRPGEPGRCPVLAARPGGETGRTGNPPRPAPVPDGEWRGRGNGADGARPSAGRAPGRPGRGGTGPGGGHYKPQAAATALAAASRLAAAGMPARSKSVT